MSIDDYAGGNGAVRLLSQHLGVPLVNLARDGATSEHVLSNQLPALRQSSRQHSKAPGLITLTIGGNDLLQAYGNDALAQKALRQFQSNLPQILTGLRQVVGNVPILLGNIYDPSDGSGDTVKLGLSHWGRALEWIAAFNAEIETQASA
jgi:lysophospholipase L1-like esterase